MGSPIRIGILTSVPRAAHAKPIEEDTPLPDDEPLGSCPG